ncbi:hypothetical protein WOC76_00370 [Methylocystis sp. IM3]|uniref:hypothetical protein n=1 Tax=unclassified Methylocystis TaxID=2625913 RepID=UPI0030F585FD
MVDIAEKIHRAITSWESCTGGKISEQGKQIIVSTVRAIVYDPHPGWRLPSGMEPWPTMEEALAEVQLDAISKIGPALDQIAAKSPDGKTVNTFEMLHSFHEILRVWCPFRKD